MREIKTVGNKAAEIVMRSSESLYNSIKGSNWMQLHCPIYNGWFMLARPRFGCGLIKNKLSYKSLMQNQRDSPQ